MLCYVPSTTPAQHHSESNILADNDWGFEHCLSQLNFQVYAWVPTRWAKVTETRQEHDT